MSQRQNSRIIPFPSSSDPLDLYWLDPSEPRLKPYYEPILECHHIWGDIWGYRYRAFPNGPFNSVLWPAGCRAPAFTLDGQVVFDWPLPGYKSVSPL